jgi:cytochrome P450
MTIDLDIPLEVPLNVPEFHMWDPYPAFAKLRTDDPVHWCEGGGYWAITRYDDALRVHRDPATFCSGQGMTMKGAELEDVKDVDTLISTDPPRHTRQRSLISRSFTPRAVGELEPRIREITTEILDALVPGEVVDFVSAVSAPLPIIVIAELLGVPIEDREKFVAWSNASVGRVDPEYAEQSLDVLTEQYHYFNEIIARRREQPRRDLISQLLPAESDDFTHDDLLRLCFLLLAAGNETTRNLVSNGFLALLERPVQMRRLLDGKVKVELAVEEMLRWTNPVIHMARTATRDVTIGERLIRAGDQVVMFYGSVNRDPEVFGDDAEEFRVDRDPNPHLAFGFGEHFCLGAALARLEGRVMFEQLLQRFSACTLEGPVDRLRSTMIRGIKHMPVRVA